MKHFRLFAVALSIALLLAAAIPATASSRHPFRGNWKGTDTFDQSNMTLSIVEESRSGGQVFTIRGTDDRTGQWCGGPAKMQGLGVLDGDNSVALSLVWWCLPAGSTILYFLDDTLTYDPSTDTISDNSLTTFHRAR